METLNNALCEDSKAGIVHFDKRGMKELRPGFVC